MSLVNNRLETNLFVKPTDRNNYLPFDSAHLITARRDSGMASSSGYEKYAVNSHQNCAVKAAQLRKKGYPQTLIREAYAKARDGPRDDLLMHREKNTATCEQKIYMTTTTQHMMA